MAEDIFISFAPQDVKFIEQLHQDLTARGLSAWYEDQISQPPPGYQQMVLEKLQAARLFLLVVSPDSAGLRSTRNQLSQAKRSGSQVLVLNWRPAPLSAMAEEQLREARRIDFGGEASVEKFKQLADLLQAALGGQPLPVETRPVEQIGSSQSSSAGVSAGQDDSLNPVAFGLRITTTLLNGIDLDQDDQEFVKTELDWLFHAADHLLKVQARQVSAGQPVACAIPLEAERKAEANNTLLLKVDNFRFGIVADNIKSRFQLELSTELSDLNRRLGRRDKFSQEGRDDVTLQEEIIENQVRILEKLEQTAREIDQAYGVLITVPPQLIAYLRETPDPAAIGLRIQTSIIPTFNLDEADRDFINEELTWLFSAVEHFRQIRQGQLAATTPISQPLPPNAERLPEANNHLLPEQPTRPYAALGETLESSLQDLNRKVKILGRRLDQEARRGQGGRDDTHLQKRIQDVRIEVVKSLQQLAKTIDRLYGIYVTSPDQLVQYLEN